MKKSLVLLGWLLIAQGAFAQNTTIQDEIQQASQTFVVLKGTSLGFSVVGSILTIAGLWQMTNGAAAGTDFLYPSKANFTLGTGLAGTGIALWMVASGLSFAADLQEVQIQQFLLDPRAKKP